MKLRVITKCFPDDIIAFALSSFLYQMPIPRSAHRSTEHRQCQFPNDTFCSTFSADREYRRDRAIAFAASACTELATLRVTSSSTGRRAERARSFGLPGHAIDRAGCPPHSGLIDGSATAAWALSPGEAPNLPRPISSTEVTRAPPVGIKL